MTIVKYTFNLIIGGHLSMEIQFGGDLYFCSFLFFDKIVTNGWILELKVSI